MKQLLTMLVLALFALATPLSGYSQDAKARVDDKGKSAGKVESQAKSEDKTKAADKGKSADKDKSTDKGKSADKGKGAEELIDINTATAVELMTLDGIGEARAAAIIKGRPYKAKNQLVSKNILPEAAYDKIKDKMIARQSAAKK